ncbi:MAG: glycosyltransferase family 2 protein, partial [Patescibacteria group bacterium]
LKPGETIGKHSNNTSSAKEVKRLLVDERHINIKNILVTTCDVDIVFPKQYFSLLTYKFLTTPNKYHRFFQAPFFMYNNVNRLPALMRLRILMSGVGYLATLQKVSGRFMSFSTYSVSLDLLDTVGYWDVDVIPEDWHINLKSYFALRGDVDIIPLNLPVLGNAPESTSAWKTFKGTYQTEKRWAWGVVDVPYVVKKFFQHPEISFWDRLKKVTLTMEWHITWSSSWFLITLGATIPTILNPAFAATSLGYNLPRMSSLILTVCMVGLITMVLYGNLLNPHNKTTKSKILAFLHPLTFLQMVTLPIFGLLLGALPGLESQTRLMLGKYIGYRVADKV